MLRLLIEKQFPVQKEIRCVNDPQEALQAIPAFKPTLLMVDIEMPEMNGFDLLNRLGGLRLREGDRLPDGRGSLAADGLR